MPSTGLLVALMFVTVLTLGIANILDTIAARAGTNSLNIGSLHIQWKLILLLQHLSLFWSTLVILNVEDWGFLGFLFILAGPALLFLATSIILPAESDDDEDESEQTYLSSSKTFFRVMTLIQFWMIGAELRVGYGMSISTALTVLAAVVTIVLSVSADKKIHRIGTIMMWLILIGVITLAEVGVIL